MIIYEDYRGLVLLPLHATLCSFSVAESSWFRDQGLGIRVQGLNRV